MRVMCGVDAVDAQRCAGIITPARISTYMMVPVAMIICTKSKYDDMASQRISYQMPLTINTCAHRTHNLQSRARDVAQHDVGIVDAQVMRGGVPCRQYGCAEVSRHNHSCAHISL